MFSISSTAWTASPILGALITRRPGMWFIFKNVIHANSVKKMVT